MHENLQIRLIGAANKQNLQSKLSLNVFKKYSNNKN